MLFKCFSANGQQQTFADYTLNSTGLRLLREMVTNQYVQGRVNKVVKVLQVSFSEKYQLK